jgi:hypothetical protein
MTVAAAGTRARDEVHRPAARRPRSSSASTVVLHAVTAGLELLRRERPLEQLAHAIVVRRIAKDEPMPEHVRHRAYRRTPARIALVDLAKAIGREGVRPV